MDVPLHPRTVDGPEGEEEEEEDAAALGEDDELFGGHSEGPEHRADSGAPLDPDDMPCSDREERTIVVFAACVRANSKVGFKEGQDALRGAGLSTGQYHVRDAVTAADGVEPSAAVVGRHPPITITRNANVSKKPFLRSNILSHERP